MVGRFWQYISLHVHPKSLGLWLGDFGDILVYIQDLSIYDLKIFAISQSLSISWIQICQFMGGKFWQNLVYIKDQQVYGWKILAISQLKTMTSLSMDGRILSYHSLRPKSACLRFENYGDILVDDQYLSVYVWVILRYSRLHQYLSV